MVEWMVAVGCVAAVGLVATNGRKDPVRLGMEHARDTGDVGPLAQAIAATPERGQGNQWDQAIGQLWRTYERDTAALLVIEAARACDHSIIQYWINQVMTVEPEIARERFTPEFLTEYYRPEIASQCGRCGCSG